MADMKPSAGDGGPTPKDWGLPLVRLHKGWTNLEARLCVWVLLAEIAALCLWITLKGLSARYGDGNSSGLVFRALIGAVALGMIANRATRPKDPTDEKAARNHSLAVVGAIVVGLLLSRAWASAGATYFSNFLNWMQTASALTLVGGLRGVATRLTLWLALLGGSLATAQGKHINIDVVMRFLTPRLRVPVAVLGWTCAAAMCFAAVWGFFDHIAIESFKTAASETCPEDPTRTCDTPAGKKVSHVVHEVGRDSFLLGRQFVLDLKSLPKVIGGTGYQDFLKGREWNEFMAHPGWKERFPPADVDALILPEDRANDPHLPVISLPGSAENVPGLLIRELNFIFPFGMLMIGLRFILRALLAISGHVRVDPDAAHADEDVQHKAEEQHAEAVAEGIAAKEVAP